VKIERPVFVILFFPPLFFSSISPKVTSQQAMRQVQKEQPSTTCTSVPFPLKFPPFIEIAGPLTFKRGIGHRNGKKHPLPPLSDFFPLLVLFVERKVKRSGSLRPSVKPTPFDTPPPLPWARRPWCKVKKNDFYRHPPFPQVLH